jgi:hypothetical protein
MEMIGKFMFAVVGLLFSYSVLAHDGGHGPKIGDAGKYGGLVTAVVLKADAEKGSKADLLYKAELVRTEGMVRVYLYDKSMKAVDLKEFGDKTEVTLATKVKGKWKNVSFPIERKDNVFQGKMPNPEAKPYNLEVTWTKDSKALLAAFDNLD